MDCIINHHNGSQPKDNYNNYIAYSQAYPTMSQSQIVNITNLYSPLQSVELLLTNILHIIAKSTDAKSIFCNSAQL